MKVLTIKTDQSKAEVAIYDDHKLLAERQWQAQGTLAETLNAEIEKSLNKLSISLLDIKGIICFKGPGSFTGLRIGMSVGNALAYAQKIPIVATKGNDWLERGLEQLKQGKNQKIVTPYYDRPAAVTMPKK